jgi:predicted nucleotidyltransferase
MMVPAILEHREQLADVCRRYGVIRLEVFGSAARGVDFDPARSDIDFLVDFGARIVSTTEYLDFEEALQALLGRRVDLIERQAVEQSRNYIRRREILTDAEAVYAR